MSDLRPKTHKIAFMGQEYDARFTLSCLYDLALKYGSMSAFVAAFNASGKDRVSAGCDLLAALLNNSSASSGEIMTGEAIRACVDGMPVLDAAALMAKAREVFVDGMGATVRADEGAKKNA